MAKRKPIRPGVRFEVFKRDGFTCQYCGRTPPTVVLQVDHIVPVARGGENDEGNLLTACEECNSGKSDKSLEEAPEALALQMERRQERAQQVEAYNAFLMEQREAEQEQVRQLGEYWFDQFMEEKGRFVFGDQRARSVRRFLQDLTYVEVLDAIDTAFSRKFPSGDYDDKTFRYFCGICWNKIKERGTDA